MSSKCYYGSALKELLDLKSVKCCIQSCSNLLPPNFHRKSSIAGPAYDQLSFLIYAEQFLSPQSEHMYSIIEL